MEEMKEVETVKTEDEQISEALRQENRDNKVKKSSSAKGSVKSFLSMFSIEKFKALSKKTQSIIAIGLSAVIVGSSVAVAFVAVVAMSLNSCKSDEEKAVDALKETLEIIK